MKCWLAEINKSWERYVFRKISREDARKQRQKLIAERGWSYVDKDQLAEIKNYCREVFDDASYWPWLAFFTEVRGEFKRGWMPDDYYRFDFLPKINPEKFAKFSETKTIDYKLFGDSIVEPLFFRSNGQYCDKDGMVLSRDEVEHRLNQLDHEIVIKRDNGHAGKNVLFREASELSLDELPEDADLLFQKVLQQHSELDKLYPHSINTFRVTTMINDDGDIEIKFIIIRFGRGGTRVDNSSQGGGWLFVKPDGEIFPMGYDNDGLEIGRTHPDSGCIYAKLNLPFIDEVINLCKRTHATFPYTRLIGWDVFVDRNSKARLIEWNADNPGIAHVETRFGPFFKDWILPESKRRNRTGIDVSSWKNKKQRVTVR